VVQEVGPIVTSGLVALVVSVLAALVLAQRLARPFQQLATVAAQLDELEAVERLPRYRFREARAIAEALRTSIRRIARLQLAERAFTRNVSHQLRTPLAVLRLEIEVLMAQGAAHEDREALERVLAEIDRLSDTVAALLALSRGGELGVLKEVSPADLLRDTSRRWAPLAQAAGRPLELEPLPDTTPLLVPVNAVAQVLDVLVDNALQHGEGRITLGVRPGQPKGVDLVVSDEGYGLVDVPDEQVFARRGPGRGRQAGEGLGLALSSDVARAVGVHLVLLDRQPTRFALRIPGLRL
jgi:signal transduction histidine kinase